MPNFHRKDDSWGKENGDFNISHSPRSTPNSQKLGIIVLPLPYHIYLSITKVWGNKFIVSLLDKGEKDDIRNNNNNEGPKSQVKPALPVGPSEDSPPSRELVPPTGALGGQPKGGHPDKMPPGPHPHPLFNHGSCQWPGK